MPSVRYSWGRGPVIYLVHQCICITFCAKILILVSSYLGFSYEPLASRIRQEYFSIILQQRWNCFTAHSTSSNGVVLQSRFKTLYIWQRKPSRPAVEKHALPVPPHPSFMYRQIFFLFSSELSKIGPFNQEKQMSPTISHN